MRRSLAGLLPKALLSQTAAPICTSTSSLLLSAPSPEQGRPAQTVPAWRSPLTASFATDAVTASKPSTLSVTDSLSLTPNSHITYDEHTHKRLPPSTNNKTTAYFVMTSGRFLYAAGIRLALLKFVVSLSAAADTLAMSSLEVDISALEEGNTVTVKWRGKPVFIRYRTEEEIAESAAVPLSDLRHPETDAERTTDPKYLIVVGICTHLGCVPIGGAGDYNGWFCPCHGSHYDTSGRIRKGPAPYNLEVPEYKFLGDGKAVIG